jgi:hypothetical protein
MSIDEKVRNERITWHEVKIYSYAALSTAAKIGAIAWALHYGYPEKRDITPQQSGASVVYKK